MPLTNLPTGPLTRSLLESHYLCRKPIEQAVHKLCHRAVERQKAVETFGPGAGGIDLMVHLPTRILVGARVVPNSDPQKQSGGQLYLHSIAHGNFLRYGRIAVRERLDIHVAKRWIELFFEINLLDAKRQIRGVNGPCPVISTLFWRPEIVQTTSFASAYPPGANAAGITVVGHLDPNEPRWANHGFTPLATWLEANP